MLDNGGDHSRGLESNVSGRVGSVIRIWAVLSTIVSRGWGHVSTV